MPLLDAEHSCRTIGGSETSGIEVHLLDLDRVGPIDPQDVLDDELARSERFHKPEDGQHFLARRVLLRPQAALDAGGAQVLDGLHEDLRPRGEENHGHNEAGGRVGGQKPPRCRHGEANGPH